MIFPLVYNLVDIIALEEGRCFDRHITESEGCKRQIFSVKKEVKRQEIFCSFAVWSQSRLITCLERREFAGVPWFWGDH